MTRARFKVALTVRDNAPSVYGVYDTHDKSGGFNGRMVAEYATEYHADQYARALNLHRPMQTDGLIGYDGVAYAVGDRVELSPSLDLWMRGAKFGTVHSVSLTPKDRVKVRSDHPSVRNLIAGPADYFRKVQS